MQPLFCEACDEERIRTAGGGSGGRGDGCGGLRAGRRGRSTRQEAQAAGPADGWQKLAVEFTTPKWEPFVELAFHAINCTVYLDDSRFTIVESNKGK